MAQIIDLVTVGFREHGLGRVEMPPKIGVHPGAGDNFIHAMPAFIPSLGSVGLKWVNGCPGNVSSGLPYISGLLILNDVETGVPQAVMDATWLTAMRTAAASAVSARHLARRESRVLGILGCGVQGRTHVTALRLALPDLDRVLAYDTEAAMAARFAEEVSEREGIEVVPVASPRAVLTDADVVVTAGPILKEPHATIVAGWLPPGGFASAVDLRLVLLARGASRVPQDRH